ncbi:211_t:CDS:2, partial [Ambispora leptoticha]
WGTKGPAVRANNAIFVQDETGIIKAQVTVPDENIVRRAHNEAYNEIRRKEYEVKRKSRKDKQEDSQKAFRTLVLFLWIFTNALLIIAIRGDILEQIMYRETPHEEIPHEGTHEIPHERVHEVNQDSRFKAYVIFIFWSVTGLTAFRFLGVKKSNLVMGIVSISSLRQGVVVIYLRRLASLRDQGIGVEKDKSTVEGNTDSYLE